MSILIDLSMRVSPLHGVRVVEDERLVDRFEDWSRVRSPSRARRRLRRGFRQNILTRVVPSKIVYSMDNGRTLVMHPEVARAYERRLAAQMDRSIELAIMTGNV